MKGVIEMKKPKRKIGKSFLPIILAGILLIGSLTGCGSSSGGVGSAENTKAMSEAKGAYTEKEVNLPSDIKNIELMGRLKDGTLEAVGLNESKTERMFYTSKDNGNSWEKGELPEGLSADQCEDIYAGTVSTSGMLFIVGSFSSDAKTYTSWIFDADGKGKALDIPFPNQDSDDADFVVDAGFSDNGNLYIADVYNQAYQINPQSGEILAKLGNAGDAKLFYVAGDSVFINGEKTIQIIDAKTGESTDDAELYKEIGNINLEETDQGSKVLVMSSGKAGIFYAAHSGMYYHALSGSVTEQLADGSKYSFGNVNTGFKNLWYIDESTFLLLMKNEQGQDALYKYTYSKDASVSPEKELKVYALKDSDTLQQMISSFQKQYPDTYVDLTVGTDSKNAATTDDALKTLNADIMAGKSPDVMVLDGMPTDSYIEKGLFTDISGIKDKAEKEDGLFSNVCDVYKKGNKLYGIPTHINFFYVHGNAQATDSASSLKTFAEYIKEKGDGEFLNLDPEVLLKNMFYADSANWIQKKKIDETGLREFYQSVKTIYDANKDKSQMAGTGEDIELLGSGGSFALAMKLCKTGFGSISSSYDLSQILTVSQKLKEEKLQYTLFENAQKKSFLPSVSLGISSKSDNQDIAEKFIQMAISSKVQAVESNDAAGGLPINKKAFDTLMEKAKNAEPGTIGTSDKDGNEVSMQVVNPTDADATGLKKIIESLDTPTITDATICEQVIEQGEKYLKGSQSEDEAVKNVMQKIGLYLSE